MAVSNRYTGAALVLEFTPTSGSLIVVSGDQKAFELNRTSDKVDITAANETAKSFLPTQTTADWTLSIFAADEAVYKYLKERATGLMDVYPKGKSAGMPRRSFNVIVEKFAESWPFDGAAEISISGTKNGAFVYDIGDTV